jgi:hypothetical protein
MEYTKWVASFRDETGRQIWRSTGLADHGSALAVAQAWEQRAERQRAAQPRAPGKAAIRVRPGSSERAAGMLSQGEVAAIMGISVRGVRRIERRALEKLRRHPALKDFWREWIGGDIKEAGLEDWLLWLGGAEIAALYALARTPEEWNALRKLFMLTQAAGPQKRNVMRF